MSEFRKVENIETTKDTEITKDTIVFHPKYGEIRVGELIRRIKISQAKKGIKRPEEFRKKMSETMKKLGIKPPTWNKGRDSRITMICENCGKSFLVNPSALKYGRKYCSYTCAISSEKYRERLSIARKGRKFSDETRRKISESRRKYFSNPLNRIKQSEIMKGKPHPDIRGDKSPTKRPEVKAKIGAKNKVKLKEFYQSHPWYREMHRKKLMGRKYPKELFPNYGMRGKHLSEETRLKISLALKGREVSLDEREKRSKYWKNFYALNPHLIRRGPNHPNWKGGISNKPYGFDFNSALRRRILERDGYKCQLCGATSNLNVHHINYDKNDNSFNNLLTLCKGCNAKMNFNRSYWQVYWSNLIKKLNQECEESCPSFAV